MTDYAVTKIAEGIGFGEGPVWTADGHIKTVDVRSGWTLDVDPQSGTVIRETFLDGGPNGLASAGERLIVATTRGLVFEDGKDGVTRIRPGIKPPQPRTPGIDVITTAGEFAPLYRECDARPLLAPNDLVLDAYGGFYFTDIGMAFERTLDPGSLYYAKLDGSQLVELVHSPVARNPLNQPNGVALSPDGRTVYVTETQFARVWAWDVVAPGVLDRTPTEHSPSGGHVLFRGERTDAYDSMAVDGEGYLCVATLQRGGITVITPDGQLEAFVAMPVWDPFVTNLCFGGPDLRTAYVTSAGTGTLWAIEWPREGLTLNT